MAEQSRRTPNSNHYLSHLLAIGTIIGTVALTGCAKGDAQETAQTNVAACVTTEISPDTDIQTTSAAVNWTLNKLPGDQSVAAFSFENYFGQQSAGAIFTACPVGSSDETRMTMVSRGDIHEITVDKNGNYTDLTH